MSSDVKISISPLKNTPSPCLNGSLNIFIGEVQKDNRCIICLDSEKLIKNNRCSCIYYFHTSCIEQVENSEQCILCKKNFITINSNPMHTNQINLTINVEESQWSSHSICISMVLVLIVCIIISSIITYI
jgi:hypothetical protein